MLRKIEKTGKSVDEALELAAQEFGVNVSELGYEVLVEIGKGLMGFLVKKEATIEAWLKKDEPKTATKTTQKNENKFENNSKKIEKKVSKQIEPKIEIKTDKKVETKIATSTNAEKVSSDSSLRTEREPRVIANVVEADVTAAKTFLSDLLTKMDIEHELKAEIIDNRINIEVSGEKMGILIGKRGDTLDAVQYLTSLYVNKDKKGYIKLNIDTENYREKREETLIRLAKRLERKVITSRKSVTLEPMSPYERRIIHAALQNSRGIKTYSVGNEPNRKIVIAVG